jgi:hypothetical protein
MNMHASPVSQWRYPAKLYSHDHSLFEKITGLSVMGRLIKNGPEAPLSIVKYLKNGAAHRSQTQRHPAYDFGWVGGH